MSKTFNMVGGGGINVVANPALIGTELELKGLEVNGAKYKVPLIRPNLLDNWYFVGGGSQQGGGQLPINQRGQTSYASNTYSIDKWIGLVTAVMTIQVNNDGIGLVRSGNTTSYPGIRQLLENYNEYVGKTLTFSILYKNPSGMRCFTDLKPATSSGGPWLRVESSDATQNWKLASGTGVFPENPSGLSISIIVGPTGNYDATFNIAAVKLELGSGQTLAHLENGVWVLNELPDYNEQLWRCQRYYQLFTSTTYRPTYGEDYLPPMRTHSPTKGTISIGGTTYYYADANL